MTLGCRRVAAEKRDLDGRQGRWMEAYKRDHKWAGGQQGCDEFSESVGGSSIRRGKLHPVCHPDRCCGHGHAVTERQRRCEKLMGPTSRSCTERDVRFWKANKPCCFDLLLLSGRGCLPLVHLVTRSKAHNTAVDAIANVCVLSALAQLIWKSLVQPHQGVMTVRALQLSLARRGHFICHLIQTRWGEWPFPEWVSRMETSAC